MYSGVKSGELDVASQGKTIEDALKNLKEAVGLYMECPATAI